MTMTPAKLEPMLGQLAEAGVTVSFAYGRIPDGRIAWSVDVLSPDGESFYRPCMARSISHAIDIAFDECVRRGWVPQTTKTRPARNQS